MWTLLFKWGSIPNCEENLLHDFSMTSVPSSDILRTTCLLKKKKVPTKKNELVKLCSEQRSKAVLNGFHQLNNCVVILLLKQNKTRTAPSRCLILFFCRIETLTQELVPQHGLLPNLEFCCIQRHLQYKADKILNQRCCSKYRLLSILNHFYLCLLCEQNSRVSCV